MSSFINQYSDNNLSAQTFNLSLPSVAANAGDVIICAIEWRDGRDLSNVLWGAQAMTLRNTLVDQGQCFTAIYTVVASATGTNTITGDFNNNAYYNAIAFVYRPAGGETLSYSTPLTKSYASGTYTAPSLTLSSVPSNAVTFSFLSALAWDSGFGDVSATTWAADAPFTLRNTITNTGYAGVNKLHGATSTSTGTVTSSWTPSAGQPQYQEVMFYIGFASGISIDSVTTADNPGLKVGGAFAITTTGLGTLASVSIVTTATPLTSVNATSLSAPSGDGTAVMPYWTDGQKYPFPGTVNVSATDAVPANATLDVTLSLPDNYIDAQFFSAITSDSTYLGYALAAISRPLADGDRGYWPNVNNLAFSATGLISVNLPPNSTMTSDLWIQKVDGTMQNYSVVINSEGQVTSASRITSSNQTLRNITSRFLTARL